MAVKPSTLIYGVDDRPPPGPALLLGLQHVAVLSAGRILVLVIVSDGVRALHPHGAVVVAEGVVRLADADVRYPAATGSELAAVD